MKVLGVTCFCFVSLMVVAWPAFAQQTPPAQVVIEAGVAHPYGELGADAQHTRLGQGAYDGLRVGFALRLPVSRTLFLSPYFAFVNHGEFVGSTPEVEEYTIDSSTYRYGLELMLTAPGPSLSLKPFLAVAVAVDRNRLRGNYQDPLDYMDRSVNTLGYTLRLGFQWHTLEFSAGYHINRFNTWHFHRSEYRERYSWDQLDLRAGWRIPVGG